MKKICMYRDYFYPIFGGVETHIDNITKNLTEYDFDILTNLISHDAAITKFRDNVKMIRIAPMDRNVRPFKNLYLNKISFPYRLLTDFERLKRKRIHLKSNPYHLVHFHGVEFCPNFLKGDLLIGKLVFTKFLDFTKMAKNKLITLHGLFHKLLYSDLRKKFDEFIVGQFDNVICVDRYIYKFVRDYIGIRKIKKNVWFIPNAIDTDVFSYSALTDDKRLKVCFIGRLDDELSGANYILNLAKMKLNWLDLTIISSCAENMIPSLKTKFFNIPNVNLFFNISNEQIPNILKNVDVVVNLVQTDAITRVTLEAMSCGRPVIMFGKDVRYPIKNNVTSFLIERDMKKLLMLLELLHHNRNLIENVGKNARKVIEKEFSNNVIIPKIKAIYDELMER